MIQAVNISPHESAAKIRFKNATKILTPDYQRGRCKEASDTTKVVSAATALAGAAFAVSMFAKKQNKSFFNVNYGLKEMLGVAFSGISGGVIGGVLTSNHKKHERKLDEGIFQFSMVAVPALAVTGMMNICERNKSLNNIPTKIGGTILAMAAGWQAAVKIANVVSDIDNNEPDRKLKFKDAIASVDDLIGILLLTKVKAVKKMKLERILPAIYAFCGYKAGTTN
ncbi:MAG: hypothetical protein NC390_06520 [Fusobacterium sp.]|nr:hypothetical protein [Fusobacterium sp.]